MKFLIIDDSGSLRSLLKKRLLQRWPEAVITGYDPRREGRPGDDFSWDEFDIVFLDYDLGLKQETGIDWLPKVKQSVHAPSVIMVTGHGSENIAVRAIRQGADDYLIKYDVVAEKLYEMVEACLAQRQTTRNAPPNLPVAQQTDPRGNPQDSGTDAATMAHTPESLRWDIPGYQCITEIARGLATTLLAERHEDGKRVVLKVHNLHDTGASVVLKRFMQELNILSDLDHPNIIKVLDHGVTEQYFYYAVDYYPKGDLADAIKSGRLTTENTVAYVLQIARGLAAVHSAGILHRDIKPNNILFMNADTVVIADLGIAKDLACTESLTVDGQVMGTPFYMSPEQIGSKVIDRHSDIYSLGVLFFEMLTGDRPFPGSSIMEVAYKHVFDPAPPLPAALAVYQPILDKMLAKVPADRYRDVEQFIHDVTNTGSG